MTAPVRANPEHIRRDFHHLVIDWCHLHTRLPKPMQTAAARRPASREYGHPSEWASDTAAKIAALLWSWHDLMAEHRNETKPPPETASERVRVRRAWIYLEPRIEQLCEIVDAEALTEIRQLHQQIRNTLGATNPVQLLPIPCPGQDCGLRTLTRRVAVGREIIVCGTCGYTVREDYYPLLCRIAIDQLAGDQQPD